MTRFPCTYPGARRAVDWRSSPPRNASRSLCGSLKAFASECGPGLAAMLSAQLAHRLLEVRDQVRSVLEANMQADGWAALPLGGRAKRFRERRDCEAFEPAPAVAQMEEVQPIQHFRRSLLGIFFLQHHAKESGGAQEIALPQRMAGIF